MKIVGGIYRETCFDPRTDNLFGSGLRAAMGISQGCEDLTLVSLGEPGMEKKISPISMNYGFHTDIGERTGEIRFIYETPVSSPRVYGLPEAFVTIPTIDVSATNVLAFAMVEAKVNVKAVYLVVDPQGLSKIEGRIKWVSDHLAIVANKREIIRLLELNEELEPDLLAEKAREKYNAEVVVVKCGALGAVVSHLGKIYHIESYHTSRVNPIGSGDVFSSVFAYYWAELRTEPDNAAMNASKATAEWVSNGPLKVIGRKKTVTAPNAVEPVFGKESRVYLAAPFFDVPERWLVDLCRNALSDLGATVFSPLHDVGRGSSKAVVFRDLEGLNRSNSILALLNVMDPGTLFEVGYASALKKNTIVYVENKDSDDLTMIRNDYAHIHDDLASAIYDAIWLGIQK